MQLDAINWHEQHDLRAWDRTLAELGGHPLQSALWGAARKRAEGIEFRCLEGRGNNAVVALARVEARRVPLLGTVAWIPKGPVAGNGIDPIPSLMRYLTQQGCIMGAWAPWKQHVGQALEGQVPEAGAAPRTIWLDLTLGKEQLLRNLDTQWRYGVGRATREGVSIVETTAAEDIQQFHALCVQISLAKGFELPASLPLMQQLLTLSSPDDPVEARLFAARVENQLVGGVFILRAGKHVHYIWGGVDREHSRVRAGEALQWAVIEWGLAQGCTLYDLEGIDPVNNPGTYQFKKKMGGQEVTLAPQTQLPLNWRGWLVWQAMQLKQHVRSARARE